MLFFGQIRPYKQVEALIAAFRETTDDSLALHVVGSPKSEELGLAIRRAADGDRRISLNLSHAADQELSAEIGEAELVVLAYQEMTNSGAALLALSLGRPVLVPASDATRELSNEVGPGWVLLFDGKVSGEILQSALRDLRDGSGSRAERPDLGQRDWSTIGRLHERVYRTALQNAARKSIGELD
jgi:beta-1,4-mannosyltransferase